MYINRIHLILIMTIISSSGLAGATAIFTPIPFGSFISISTDKMPITDFLPTMDANFIKDVGFPIAISVSILGILIYVMKRDSIRQEKSDTRYENLVNNLLQTTKDRSDKHDVALKELDSELKKITSELKIITTKVDTYINKYFEAKSVTYIFKEGKIDKIKNMIKEREVIHDIDKKIVIEDEDNQ